MEKHLPLPNIQAATSEAMYCLDTLKMDGIALLSNYQGFYLSDEGSDELLAELNKRSAIVLPNLQMNRKMHGIESSISSRITPQK